MLKKLDWYILKKYLSTFVFVVLILVAVIIVIDFTEKNDDFIKRHAPVNKILFDYYLNYIPYIANMLSPITVFIATVFVTARLASHTEIIAILSSGVSFRRLLLPYAVGAIFIGILTFLMTGWMIPNSNEVRVNFERQYLKDPFFYDNRNIHIKIAPEVYVYMESYNNTINTGYKFTMERIVGTQLLEKLEGQRITWQPTTKKWLVEDFKHRTFQGSQETIRFGSRLDTTINLKPEDFGSTHLQNETYTLTELDAYIKELRERGADNIQTYVLDRYQRFTYPFAILILTLIGVIVSARKSRGGVGFQIAFGFVLAFVYILFFMLSTSLAQVGGLHPLLAVWLPNLIFAAVGTVMYFTVPR